MKRDLQINYGVLDDIIAELHSYKNALVKMNDSLDKVSTFIQTNKGKSVEAWDQNIDTSKDKIEKYETQINDLLSLFENYLRDTTVYISPISRNQMMRVDRNDIWANLKQIDKGMERNVLKALNRSYQTPSSFSSLFEDPTDAEKEASESNRRNMERIQESIRSTRTKLQNNMDDLWELYNTKIKRFENVDDAYNDLAGNVKKKYTNFFEGVQDIVDSINNGVDNLVKGLAHSIAGLVEGLVTVAMDVGVVGISGAIPDSIEPAWLKEKADQTVDNYTQAMIQLLQDPIGVVESAAQSFTDTVEQEGVMYVTGAALPSLIPSAWAVKGVKGVSKLGSGGKSPKLTGGKPYSKRYFQEKVNAGKAALSKVKMPVFYREQLSTGYSTIPMIGVGSKPLGEIHPQMYTVTEGRIEGSKRASDIKKHMDDVLKRSTCSPKELHNYLNNIDSKLAEEFTNTGKWPKDIQIPKDSSVLTADGNIDWSQVPNGGYVLDEAGNAIKEAYIPKVGEIIDRYGANNGRYTSPVKDGIPYSYDQRSLPYVEDSSKYHQYKVVGDFNKISNYIDDASPELKKAVEGYMKKYNLKMDDLTTQAGKIAPGFGSKGYGVQYELPMPVSLLEDLKILLEVK
ncbi:TNT domain-containing protein [Virgibacillus proomii]|uniref:TNT domain-containing protein n=1 Tax=Virgibacillus proomii TaxID=84407 RepID=UPI000984AEDD|nr:TNT domain-containing protein [Virgibacillus proomii]